MLGAPNIYPLNRFTAGCWLQSESNTNDDSFIEVPPSCYLCICMCICIRVHVVYAVYKSLWCIQSHNIIVFKYSEINVNYHWFQSEGSIYPCEQHKISNWKPTSIFLCLTLYVTEAIRVCSGLRVNVLNVKHWVISGLLNYIIKDESCVPFPDSKIYGAKMGPSRVLSARGGPQVGPSFAPWTLVLNSESLGET